MASSGTIGKINAGGNDYLVASTAFAVCNTSADTAAKVATIQDGADFTLIDGVTIHVYFDASNTASNATLNVNNTGAYSIYFATNIDTYVKPGITPADSWTAGAVVTLTYYNREASGGAWYINNNTPAIFPVVFTPTSQDFTTATSSKRAWEISFAVVSGQIPLGLLAMGQSLYAISYLTYTGLHPLTQQSVSIFSYTCHSTNVFTHLNYHYATLTVDDNSDVTIQWTDLVHGVTLDSTSVVSSTGVAELTTGTSSGTLAAGDHTHGNITTGGDITTNVAIASGDRLVINDESASKINNSSITFGTSTTQFLANNGTWQTPAGGVSDVTVDGDSVVSDGVAAIVSQWRESSNKGLYHFSGPNRLSNADSTISYAAIAAGNFVAYNGNSLYAPDNSIAAGKASFTMLDPVGFALASSTAAGATSYSFNVNVPLLDGDVNYLKSLYYFSPNAPASPGALQPTSASYSNGTLTLTFSSSLNPTAAITYLFIGNYNKATSSVVVGSGLTTTDSTSGNILIGNRLVNTGFYNLQVGQNQYDSGSGSGLIGFRLKNSANGALVVGNNQLNSKNYAALLGEGHNSTNGPAAVTAVGTYSTISSDTAFVVGVGTSSARSNAFEVHTDGRATLGAGPTANMDVVTKQYADGLKGKSGSTDTSSKIYLVGATSQAADVTTYSDNQVYATNGQLDANKVRIAEHATLQYNSTDSAIEFVFA